MICPFCHGEVDEQHDFLDHAVEWQKSEAKRWQSEFDAGLRRAIDRRVDASL